MVFIKLPLSVHLSVTVDLYRIQGWGTDEEGEFHVVVDGRGEEIFLKEADFETRIQAVRPLADSVVIYDFTTPAAEPLLPIPTE